MGVDDRAAIAALEAIDADAGRLPDGRVDDVDATGWQWLLDHVRDQRWRAEWSGDGAGRAPTQASELFGPELGTLSIWIDEALQINVFPYDTTSIDFDVDLGELHGEHTATFVAFIRSLGRGLQRDVRLSHEGAEDLVFLTFDEASDRFVTPMGSA